ncbi:biopolymer transporter ExbD [Halarcobacter ebronensis]|uniref:Biopolymer transporter ExbD n=1 Tax=Halarcobacter ebronensis TaxID=1462615 RepID=A0A4Q0YEJ4_9BACT|nr:biopolymer transporter ExbD [Halarcobacter ebronensis]RXJ68947.1 biopolymer transporter ExbD [Halarcobacter ebronensis]
MKRREPIGIDLTPVIDVVFILLIFFIVTSVFKKEELALMLNLPQSSAKAAQIDNDQIFIELNQDKVAIRGISVNFESLEESLKVIKNKKKPVIIRIDKDTKYDRVTKVLDLLQKYDLNNLALVTEEKE